jgi:hypothetical protein
MAGLLFLKAYGREKIFQDMVKDTLISKLNFWGSIPFFPTNLYNDCWLLLKGFPFL